MTGQVTMSTEHDSAADMEKLRAHRLAAGWTELARFIDQNMTAITGTANLLMLDLGVKLERDVSETEATQQAIKAVAVALVSVSTAPDGALQRKGGE